MHVSSAMSCFIIGELTHRGSERAGDKDKLDLLPTTTMTNVLASSSFFLALSLLPVLESVKEYIRVKVRELFKLRRKRRKTRCPSLTHICVCVCVCACARSHACVRVSYASACVCVCACMCACVCVFARLSVYLSVYLSIFCLCVYYYMSVSLFVQDVSKCVCTLWCVCE